MTSWSESDAQAQLDTLLDNAESEGPQRVTRGERVFYIMTRQDWDALGRPPALKRDVPEPEKGVRTLSEFFKKSPLVDSGIDLTRNKSGPREIDLGK